MSYSIFPARIWKCKKRLIEKLFPPAIRSRAMGGLGWPFGIRIYFKLS
jgi:hypothetical protein